jgi:hypothetical protein
MDLLSEELRKTLPPLYSQESSGAPVVHAKVFTPDAGWTWLITEGSEQDDGDWLLFGYVIGLEEEWGYFLLSEIAGIRGPLRLPVERDLWFRPGPIDEVRRRERQPAVAHGKGARDER